ncbi:uncharacterized protein LOC113426447 [Notechis scutatus]|uniref:Uncharacterized protein LOC113426447 n=1 Tax=Notechis scutatus TaxID=8663 RepID=A0A6J1VN91_9SAUR|nr:uncharacterized protein LOC113426447 [Notechis scutatus]
MSEHLLNLNATRSDLLQRGETITEGSFISIIINSLDSSWDYFLNQLDNLNYDNISFETLSGRLVAADNLRKDRALLHKEHRVVKRVNFVEQVNALLGCYTRGSRDHFKKNCPKAFKGREPIKHPLPYYTSYQRERSNSGQRYQGRHPSSQRHDVNLRRRKSSSPRRSRRSSWENNRTDTDSVNGIRDVELNLGVNIREQCWLIDSGATAHTSCNRELFTCLDEVSFNIKVANQKFMQVVGKGDIHIPGLGRIKEVLFIPEIPYNVLSVIKLSKGTKIKVLFKVSTIQLTNDSKEVGDVIVTSRLSYFIPTINTTAQIIANLSNDGVKNGKEEREKDDNADSDTSDGEIEGESDNDINDVSVENVVIKTNDSKHISIGKPLHNNCAHILHR